MDYLQMAKDALEQSEGDIRWEGQKERLMELATVYVAIAQAEAAQRSADQLEFIRTILEHATDDQPFRIATNDPIRTFSLNLKP